VVNQKNNRNTSGNARLVGVIVLAFQGILFASSSAQRLDVSLVEEYAIGDDPGREAPYLLGGPQSISVNSPVHRWGAPAVEARWVFDDRGELSMTVMSFRRLGPSVLHLYVISKGTILWL